MIVNVISGILPAKHCFCLLEEPGIAAASRGWIGTGEQGRPVHPALPFSSTLDTSPAALMASQRHAFAYAELDAREAFTLGDESLESSLSAARSVLLILHEGGRFFGIAGVESTRHAQGPLSSELETLERLAPLVVASVARASSARSSAEATPAGPRPAPARSLSPSEHRVAELIIAGYAAPNVAALTGLSEHTVRTYVRRIHRKLGVHSRAELVRRLLASKDVNPT